MAQFTFDSYWYILKDEYKIMQKKRAIGIGQLMTLFLTHSTGSLLWRLLMRTLLQAINSCHFCFRASKSSIVKAAKTQQSALKSFGGCPLLISSLFDCQQSCFQVQALVHLSDESLPRNMYRYFASVCWQQKVYFLIFLLFCWFYSAHHSLNLCFIYIRNC